MLGMFEGPPGCLVQRNEPYILLQTSNFPLAGAVRLCQPHRVQGRWMALRAHRGPASMPGARPGVGRAPVPAVVPALLRGTEVASCRQTASSLLGSRALLCSN